MASPEQDVSNSSTEQVSAPEIAPISEKERKLYELDLFVEKKVEEALRMVAKKIEEMKVQGRDVEKFRFITNELKKVFSDFEGASSKPNFKISSEILPDPSKRVRLRFDHTSGSVGHVAGSDLFTITLPLQQLYSAQTLEEFDDARIALVQTIYHEIEHIELWGADVLDTKDSAAIVEYLCNPGEMRAYAKQYAYLYVEHFTGEPFRLEDMRQIIQWNRDGQRQDIPKTKIFKAIAYFEQFFDRAFQKKYEHTANLQEVAIGFMRLVNKFVDEMNVIRAMGLGAIPRKE
jgi:hypothetical protein